MAKEYRNGLSREQREALSGNNRISRPEKKNTGGKLNDVLVAKPKNKAPLEYKTKENRLHFTEQTNENNNIRVNQQIEKPRYEYRERTDNKRERVQQNVNYEDSDSRPEEQPAPVIRRERAKAPSAPVLTSQGFAYRGKFDISLFIIVMVLAVFGITMMTSASYAYSLYNEDDSFSYMFQQLQGFAIGFVFLLIVARFDYRSYASPIKNFFLKKMTVKSKKPYEPKNGDGLNVCHLFFVFSIGLMVLTYVFGEEVAGAKRWITIFGLRFQPSEIMKVAMIMLLASMMLKLYSQRHTLKNGVVAFFIVIGICAAFCVAQRHYSALLIVVIIGVAMMIGHGSKPSAMVVLCVVGVFAVLMVLVIKPGYLGDRITGWFAPFSDMGDTTYQTSQSLITIGSGGWFGRGLGNSIQKYYYLPEAQNDFVFSIICEELGFVGGITVILLFVLFEVRGFYIAARAKDRFGAMLALGITIQIGFQAMFNIGVACNAFPNTGISLPFFSYGRTALIIQLVEAGLLLSVSRDSDV